MKVCKLDCRKYPNGYWAWLRHTSDGRAWCWVLVNQQGRIVAQLVSAPHGVKKYGY